MVEHVVVVVKAVAAVEDIAAAVEGIAAVVEGIAAVVEDIAAVEVDIAAAAVEALFQVEAWHQNPCSHQLTVFEPLGGVGQQHCCYCRDHSMYLVGSPIEMPYPNRSCIECSRGRN